MSILVRKIDKGKWLTDDSVNAESIPADAITGCMKTKNNTLSVWEIDTEDNLNKAYLAIASGLQHLESIDVVLMDADVITKEGIDYEKTLGQIPIKALSTLHLDLINLTYNKLGTIASHIVDKFKENKVKRLRRNELKSILSNAIHDGLLLMDTLNPDVKKHFQ